jgi:hypothetical protein
LDLAGLLARPLFFAWACQPTNTSGNAEDLRKSLVQRVRAPRALHNGTAETRLTADCLRPNPETNMRLAFAALCTLAGSPDSSHTIVAMCVSSVGEDERGDNILMVEGVEPGVSDDVTVADGPEV